MNNAPKSPWHAGELAMQERAGVIGSMDVIGMRAIRPYLGEQQRAFFSQLPFVVAGTVDSSGDAWATLLAGMPGFLFAPTQTMLRVAPLLDRSDPASEGLREGSAIGLLGIDLSTRRRSRVNGQIQSASGKFAIEIQVQQSYGNCNQYIHLREYELVQNTGAVSVGQTMSWLTGDAKRMIEKADTFFIASYVKDEAGQLQVDVSHKGGRPGFVRIDSTKTLTIPDFSGNLYFNTLGNILVNSKTGLVFVDFETGDVLQLTGDAEVLPESPEMNAFQGAERLWRFTPRKVVLRVAALPLRFMSPAEGVSHSVLMTGTWTDVAARLQAAYLRTTWRPFRVSAIVDESTTIRSILLQPIDGTGLAPNQPGQHLPIRLRAPGTDEVVYRTYTLSSAPSDQVYRISVKQEGQGSQLLHRLGVGDVIEAQGPAGTFVIDARARRLAILLAAGVGITPMLAMLRSIVYEGVRTRQVRPTWIVYSARSVAERAFDDEIAALVQAANGSVRLTRLLSNPTSASSADYELAGRVDRSLLRELVPEGECDFFLCGPGGFMQDVYDGLAELNVPDERIFAESFGPASLRRRRQRIAEEGTRPESTPCDVIFAVSGKTARWAPEAKTLLQFAESQGLAPSFACRSGNCGTCHTRVLEGAVAYISDLVSDVPEGEALICCAVPATGKGVATLRLDL